jgi:hypothetical protein
MATTDTMGHKDGDLVEASGTKLESAGAMSKQ